MVFGQLKFKISYVYRRCRAAPRAEAFGQIRIVHLCLVFEGVLYLL